MGREPWQSISMTSGPCASLMGIAMASVFMYLRLHSVAMRVQLVISFSCVPRVKVLRGYSGDRSAPQRFNSALFKLAGGDGFQRPFELATVRLANMIEVLGRWRQYVPDDRWMCQRGGTFMLDADDSLLYCHRDRGILGFSETMNRPLSYLDAYLDRSN